MKCMDKSLTIRQLMEKKEQAGVDNV